MRKALIVFVLLSAHVTHAQVFISEIKYTGNEWIEVSNSGSTVDLSLWKFFEGNTNHKLKPVQGGTSISSGGHAIIANDATAFLNEYGGFSGTLFDSSFSLLDAGEAISIKSSDTNVVDTVSYGGMKGSKNSLQKINGAWKEMTPTPGAPAGSSVSATQEGVQGVVSPGTPASVVEARVSAENGAERRRGIVGVPVAFEADIRDTKNQPLVNARAMWTFGDGGSAEGARINHVYHYAGDYVVVLDISSSEYSATTRVEVQVVEPRIALRAGGDTTRSFVALENKGSDELDLSGWQIRAGEKSFMIPKNTFLGARKTITFASEVMEFVTPEGSSVELFYENGTKVPVEKNIVETKSVAVEKPKLMRVDTPSAALVAKPSVQKAAVADAVASVPPVAIPQAQKEEKMDERLWIWYTGVSILCLVALLGFRAIKTKKTFADEFEIIEENDKKDIF